MVQARLRYILVSRDILSPAKAGFMTGHSTKDQVPSVIGAVANSCHHQKRTVTVLVDFTRAFNSVRVGVAYKLAIMGLCAATPPGSESSLSSSESV